LRQDLLDEPRVGLVEAAVKGGKRLVTRWEVPRFGELALRAWVRELHEDLTPGTGLRALFSSKDISIVQYFKSNCLHAVEWTQLNYDWWTLLEPHVTDSYRKEAKAARHQGCKDLEDENKVLPDKIRQVRGG
jgi:hypothetical protein